MNILQLPQICNLYQVLLIFFIIIGKIYFNKIISCNLFGIAVELYEFSYSHLEQDLNKAFLFYK